MLPRRQQSRLQGIGAPIDLDLVQFSFSPAEIVHGSSDQNCRRNGSVLDSFKIVLKSTTQRLELWKQFHQSKG